MNSEKNLVNKTSSFFVFTYYGKDALDARKFKDGYDSRGMMSVQDETAHRNLKFWVALER